MASPTPHPTVTPPARGLAARAPGTGHDGDAGRTRVRPASPVSARPQSMEIAWSRSPTGRSGRARATSANATIPTSWRPSMYRDPTNLVRAHGPQDLLGVVVGPDGHSLALGQGAGHDLDRVEALRHDLDHDVTIRDDALQAVVLAADGQTPTSSSAMTRAAVSRSSSSLMHCASGVMISRAVIT